MSSSLHDLCRKCKRCPSEPRDVFNASDSLWSEEDVNIVLTSKIPPLAILLNDSEYTLDLIEGNHSITTASPSTETTTNGILVFNSSSSSPFDSEVTTESFFLPVTMSSADEDENDHVFEETNATTTLSTDSLISSTVWTTTTAPTTEATTTSSIFNETYVTHLDSTTTTTFASRNVSDESNESVTEGTSPSYSFIESDHNSFTTTSLPEISLREPSVTSTSPTTSSEEESVTSPPPIPPSDFLDNTSPGSSSVITRIFTDDLEEDPHSRVSTYFDPDVGSSTSSSRRILDPAAAERIL